MADVFMSYVSQDRTLAEQVSRGLQADGLSVWWDRDIHGGADFAAEIDRELTAARVVIVLWSAASQASQWVRDEASQARDEKKLIPVRIDAARPPLGFRQVQTLDLQGWSGDPAASAFANLLGSIRRLLGGGTTALAASTPASTPERASWISRNRWRAISGAVIVAVIVAGVAAFFGLRQQRVTPDGNDGRIEIRAFEPTTKTEELARFAQGVTETTVRVFATNNIKAVTQSQAGAAASTPANAPEFVLRGTVDRDGDKFVVNADVLHTREGVVLWSTKTQGNAAQLRLLENRFSTTVASVLRCALRGRSRTRNDPSIDLFGKILGFCAASADGRVDQFPELAQRIVEAAPQYADSYALRATANAFATDPDFIASSKPLGEVARLRKLVYDDARRAEQMDPTVDSYFARALVDDPSVDLAAREKLWLQSIKVNSAGSGRWGYGWLLLTVGRIHDARETFEQAASADPLDLGTANEAARTTGWTGDLALARKRFDDLREMRADPSTDWAQFWMELQFGDPAIAQKISKTYVNVWVGSMKQALASDRCGRALLDARVRAVHPSKAQLDAACPEGNVDLYGYFGYADAAIALWEAGAFWQGWSFTLFMPHNLSVRANPRFMHVAARFGLVDYWLNTGHWPDFCKEEKLPYDCRTAALAVRASVMTQPLSATGR